MHQGLCYTDDLNVESALRQAFGAISIRPGELKTSSIHKLAEQIEPLLLYPDKAGDGRECRLDNIVTGITQLVQHGLIELYGASGFVEVTAIGNAAACSAHSTNKVRQTQPA